MHMEKITLGVADDHPVVYEGLVNLLGRYKHLEVKFTADNGQEVLNKLKERPVDIVLLDLDMPVLDGEATFHKIKEKFPAVKAILFSGYFKPGLALQYIKKDFPAVIGKTWPIHKIVEAIETVQRVGEFVDESVYKLIRQNLVRENDEIREQRVDLQLNMMQILIVKYMCLGYTTARIAEKLNKAEKTIDGHRSHIWKVTKIQSGDIDALTIFAIKHNIVNII